MSGLRWQQALARLHGEGAGFVLVTLLETRGSSPRDDDAKMVISADAVHDSIGGGTLEHRCIAMARAMLGDARAIKRIEEFSLGPDLDQCCGGRVRVLLECFPGNDFNVQLYGAGHVGRALVSILGELDCRVRWIDPRAEAFPQDIPGNVEAVVSEQVFVQVEAGPADAWHLVMTHSHPLDLEICEAVLSRRDCGYLGLIGSRSKAVRFRKRLAEKGFGDAELARLHCPIGLSGLDGKAPMQIAVSVAADLMLRRQEARAVRSRATVGEIA